MSKKAQDLKFGLEKETECIDNIMSYFKCGELKKTSKYGIIDFYNKTHYFELKSRRNEYLKYPTTICGINKIEYFKKLKQECYLLFNFTDGLYYIKYDSNIFNNFEIKEEKIYRDDKTEIKINIHIPIIYLNKII